MGATRRTARAVLGLLALTVVAAVSGCSTSASTSGSSNPAVTKAPRYSSGSTLSARLPTSVMDAAFTDSAGRTVHLSDLAGKTVVIQDSMTLCQELCPIDTSTLVATARDYASAAKAPDDVVFLTITVDPQRDTPTQLAAYRHQYVGASSELPSWRLLTGSPADVAALWKALGVYVEKVPQDDKVRNWRTGRPLTYDVEHSDQVFFLDTTGRERYLLDGMPALGTAQVPAAMQRFMSADGHRNETKKQGWTAAQGLGVLAWLTSTT